MYFPSDPEASSVGATGDSQLLQTRRRKSTTTFVCALIGLLCAAGAVLAAFDPSLTGRASGPGLNALPSVDPTLDDDGFVPPPVSAHRPDEKPPENLNLPKLPPEPNTTEGLAARAVREAQADALIEKLLVKIRAEKAERLAERKRGDE